MRLIKLTVGTLLIAFILFMTIRMWGQGQVFKPFDAPFFKTQGSYVIIPWEQNFLLEKKADLILWVDVYRSQNQELLVKPWVDRNKAKKDLEQSANPARPLLKDLLLKFPKTRFVINCNDNVQDIQIDLAKVIEEGHASERVLLQSDYNTILISTKELNPMIVFGSTVADLTRLKTFESMALLPAAPFKSDTFFSPLKYHGRTAVDEELVAEMKRRFKKVILGPLATREDIQKAEALKADGFFVEDPLIFMAH